MKIALFMLLISSIVQAAQPTKTPNFFEVDTDTTDIRPDKQVAIEHYKNKLKELEIDRRTRQQKPGLNAAERNMQSSQMINPAL